MSDITALSKALAPLYTLERELSDDPIGRVFLARSGDGEEALVTVLADDVVASMKDRNAFVAGVERAGKVRETTLIPFLGAGMLPEGSVYFATRYADGESGLERVRRTGTLPVSDIAEIGRVVALALSAAHAAGVMHGAVMPAHLRFTTDGVRLTNLGVLNALIAAGVDPLVANGKAAASQYFSPEQRTGDAIDARSDIYMLGATLYEFLTGKPPFGGRTTSTVMASVLADEPTEAVEGGETQAPGHVVNAILRAIEHNPDDRWPSASAFAEGLRETPAAEAQSAAPRTGCLPVVVLALIAGMARLRA